MPQIKDKFSGNEGTTLYVMLYRYAAIIKLLGFNPTIQLDRLPSDFSSSLLSDEFMYSEQKERLLFLYAAGAITEKCLKMLLETTAEITDVLVDLETMLINEPQVTDKDIVSNSLMMCSGIKSHSIFKPISFKAAYELSMICAASSDYISFDGEIISYSTEFTDWLYKINEPLAIYKGRNFIPANEQDTEMFLIDIPKLPFILNYVKKLYGKEFIENIFRNEKFDPALNDLDWSSRYDEFLSAVKLQFDITGYLRKRNICTDCNIIDYRQNIIVDGKLVDSKMNFESGYKQTIQLELRDISEDLENPTSDDELINIALARYEENCLMGTEKMVVEVLNNGSRTLYKYENGKFEMIDKDKFETIPFNYDKVWTFIQQASKTNSIRTHEGKVTITLEVAEQYTLTDEEMGYAERMLIDQIKRQRMASPILTKLSELMKRAKDKPASDSGQAGGKSAAPKMQEHKTSDEI